MKAKLFIPFISLGLPACSQSPVPSITDGTGRWVSCFFEQGTPYQDLTVKFKFDKIKNSSEIQIDQKDSIYANVDAFTKNRISVSFKNSKGESIKFRISLVDGSFVMLNDSWHGGGYCEESNVN